MERFILYFLLWVFIGIFNVNKELKCTLHLKPDERSVFIVLSFIVAPIWLLGAIVRQTIIEDWK
jgi:hypothetical protein